MSIISAVTNSAPSIASSIGSSATSSINSLKNTHSVSADFSKALDQAQASQGVWGSSSTHGIWGSSDDSSTNSLSNIGSFVATAAAFV